MAMTPKRPQQARQIKINPSQQTRPQPPKKSRAGLFLLVLLLVVFAVGLVLILTHNGPNNPPDVTTTTELPVSSQSETSTPPTETSTPASQTSEPPATTPTSSTGTTTPETQPPTTSTVVSFAAAGDVLIHECVFLDAKTSSGYDFSSDFQGISSLVQTADVAYVNMECPIAGNELGVRGYPNFNAPEEAGQALLDLGFNVINIANNHMLDMEKIATGYQNSIRFWKAQDCLMIGGYESQSDYDTPRIIEASGIRIAFLSYTCGNGATTKTVNSKSSGLIAPILTFKDKTNKALSSESEALLKKQIQKAQAAADLVIVSMHWGQDSKAEVSADQKTVAKALADLGVSAIIGSHSHVIQPIEWIHGANGNQTLCVYSLGNLISSQLYKSMILENVVTFDICRDGETGVISLDNIIAHPIVCHYEVDKTIQDGQGFDLRYNIRLYRLEDYTADLCAKHGAHNAFGDYKKDTESFTLSTLAKDFKAVINQAFLPSFLR